jgi:hypothetical protein
MRSGQPPYHDIKANLRSTRILFGAIVMGAVLLALVVLGLHATDALGPATMAPGDAIRGIVAAGGLVCIFIAFSGYRKAAAATKNLTGSLNDKLVHHRSFLTRYMAICDFAAIASILTFFLTGDVLLLIVTGVVILAMLYMAPTKNRLINDLGLDWNEQAEL